jgi:hypothetical protein
MNLEEAGAFPSVLVLLVLALSGCTKQSAQRPTGDSTVSASAPIDSSNRIDSSKATLVRATCDSAAALVHEALGLDIQREDGDYLDSAHGARRSGCRIKAAGSFGSLQDQNGPVAALEKGFTRQGWRGDLRYESDGPDGSNIGLRKLEMLCLVRGSWDGGDDEEISEDTAPAQSSPAESRYEATVECGRDVPSNSDAGVPDSIWSIARERGLDSVNAISLHFQYPPYLAGDFDGDGVSDAAVRVERRSTGKTGIAIVHRGTRRVTILSAGSGSAGSDDLSWAQSWDIFPKGTTYHLTIGDRPRLPLGADALWVGRQDSLSAFYVWTGANYVFESHPVSH